MERAELEQQLGARFGERHEPELIDDQELVFLGLLNEPWQVELVLAGQQVVDQAHGGAEAHAPFLSARRLAKRERDVAFSRARVAQQSEIRGVGDFVAAGEIEHQGRVEIERREVEVGELLDQRRTGGSYGAGVLVAVALGDLLLGQAGP